MSEWLTVAFVGLGILAFLAYFFWKPKRIHALAVVGRVEVWREGQGKAVEAKARLFYKELGPSDEWWPLGSFETLSEAASAIRRFHGDRVDGENLIALVEDGTTDVIPLQDCTDRPGAEDAG